MIARTLHKVVIERARHYPVMCLTGPRQSGKTTLSKAAVPDFRHISLEDPQNRTEAIEDHREFLERRDGCSGAILDKVQRALDLCSYLQGYVDDECRRPR
ncbi:AAA family ATPase [bacterium]|nr:AAA family ATPase [candidate division CSSED10-310 bacterium]